MIPVFAYHKFPIFNLVLLISSFICMSLPVGQDAVVKNFNIDNRLVIHSPTCTDTHLETWKAHRVNCPSKKRT